MGKGLSGQNTYQVKINLVKWWVQIKSHYKRFNCWDSTCPLFMAAKKDLFKYPRIVEVFSDHVVHIHNRLWCTLNSDMNMNMVNVVNSWLHIQRYNIPSIF